MWPQYLLIATWLAYLVGSLWFAWRFPTRLDRSAAPQAEPPATVVTPVKGAGPHLAAFLARLRSQDYPDYRIIEVVESSRDPALPLLQAAAVGDGAPLSIEIAGLAERQGQKVHNLIHALERLDDRARIIAFIDADTLPAADWLARVVRPLVRNETIAAVTGHRWIVPDGPDLASAVVAAANFSAIALLRFRQVCWGGTLAFRRETFDRLSLLDHLRGAIVEDVQITRVLHEAGERIVTPRGLVVVSPVRHGWASAFAFGRRQYMFCRIYLPGVWALGLAALSLPVAASACAIILAIRGDPVAVAALAVALICGQVRARLRRRIVEALDVPQGSQLYRRHAWADRWLPAVWVPFHAACAWSSAVSNRISWSGTVYEVRGRNDVRVVQRNG